MKKNLLLFILLLANLSLFSQTDFNNYQSFNSSGIVPSEFLISQAERYTKLNQQFISSKIFTKEASRNKFAFRNAQKLSFLYNSGLITFNDPISKYAEKVLDIVLKDDKELRSKVRIFTIKSTEANAFTTSDGNIFISVGLMAQLQNEAQLAYIISHELVHFVKEHHAKSFVNTEEIIKKKNNFSSSESMVNYFFSYQKDHEYEADKLGFSKYYKNTGYSSAEIENLFDVLLYSYLPIDEIEFDLAIFESENYKFPEEYKLDEVKEITAIEDYDDKKSTHPNILKRRTKILMLTQDLEKKGSKYIVSEKEFKNAKKIASFELSYLYRANKDFEKSIYNSYILLKEYPDNKYLKTNLVEALYGLAFYKNKLEFNKIHTGYKDIEGYSQQVNFLMKKLKKEELNMLALRYAWNLSREFKSDKYIQQLTDSVIIETARSSKSSLLDYPLQVAANDTATVDYESMTKVEKVKYRKKEQKITKKTSKYYYNSLVDLPENKKLIQRYKYLSIDYDNDEISNEEKLKLDKEKIEKDKEKYGYALGIDTLILIQPVFNMKNKTFTNEKIKKTFKKQSRFDNDINKIAKKLDLNIINIYDKIDENDIEKINDFSVIMMWIYEMIGQENTNYIAANQKLVTNLSKKYGTKHFAWIGVNYDSSGRYYYNYYVFDLENGKLVLHENSQIKKIHFDLIKANIYKSLYQTKRKNNKK